MKSMKEPVVVRARTGDPFLAATLCAAAMGLVLTALGLLWGSTWQPRLVVAPVPNSILLATAILIVQMAVFHAVMRRHAGEEGAYDDLPA